MRLNNTNMTSDDSGKLVLNYKIVGIESVRIEPKEFVKEFFYDLTRCAFGVGLGVTGPHDVEVDREAQLEPLAVEL